LWQPRRLTTLRASNARYRDNCIINNYNKTIAGSRGIRYVLLSVTATLGVAVSNLTQNIGVQVCPGSFYDFIALFFWEDTPLNVNKIIKNTIYMLYIMKLFYWYIN
jgi:hypothetical protein